MPQRPPPPSARRPRAPVWIVLGIVFSLVATAGYIGWTEWSERRAQQERIAALTEALRTNREMATRNRPLDLTSVRPEITAIPARTSPSRPAPLRAGAAERQIDLLFAGGSAPQSLRAQAATDLALLISAVERGDFAVLSDPVVTDQPRVRLDLAGQQAAQLRLESLLMEAYQEGTVQLSPSFLTTDGGIDGSVLVFDLLLRALRDGSDADRSLALDLSAEITALAPTDADPRTGLRHHLVADGDSLAYIALLHYGDASAIDPILAANSSQMGTRDEIRPGQRLFIPFSLIIR